MQLFIVELGDIGDRILHRRNGSLLARRVEHVGLDDADIDAAQRAQIEQVLRRSAADDRENAARRAVIEDGGEILRHLDRGEIAAAGDDLDEPAILALDQGFGAGQA